MNDQINLNDLWAKQTSTEPSPKDLIFQIKTMKKKNLRKLIIQNFLLLTTSIFILFVWFSFQPRLIATKIGIIFIILAMAIFLFVYNKSYNLFKNNNITSKSNKEYLNDLLAIKAKQQFIHSTILNLYFVLLSIGISLYMYEYTSRMSLYWGVFTYGITALWILFNWFYLRPKQIIKQQNKLDEIIDKFEKIIMQLD